MYACMYVYSYMHAHTCVYVCTYAYIYVCIHNIYRDACMGTAPSPEAYLHMVSHDLLLYVFVLCL